MKGSIHFWLFVSILRKVCSDLTDEEKCKMERKQGFKTILRSIEENANATMGHDHRKKIVNTISIPDKDICEWNNSQNI